MSGPKKISQLTTAGPLTGVELLPIVQNSGTLQTTISEVAIFATSAVTGDVSALEVRVSAASATGATNSAAITSINAVLVSILAILTNTNFRVTE
jgi:hypothetical protein